MAWCDFWLCTEGKERMVTLTSGGIIVLFTKVEEGRLGLMGRTRPKTGLIIFKMPLEHLGKAIQYILGLNACMKFRREILAYIFMEVRGTDIEVQEVTLEVCRKKRKLSDVEPWVDISIYKRWEGKSEEKTKR